MDTRHELNDPVECVHYTVELGFLDIAQREKVVPFHEVPAASEVAQVHAATDEAMALLDISPQQNPLHVISHNHDGRSHLPADR
jgi:hypothetical protein